MSHVVSMRLKDDQIERLQRIARRIGRTTSEASALLIEEALRQNEFAHIEFRESPVGRQAYIKGTRLAVWQVVMIGREYEMDATKTAEYFNWPLGRVKAAFSYAEAFAVEIDLALKDADSMDDAAVLSRLLPELEIFTALFNL